MGKGTAHRRGIEAASFAKSIIGLEEENHNGGGGPLEHGCLGLLLSFWAVNLRAEPALGASSGLHLLVHSEGW